MTCPGWRSRIFTLYCGVFQSMKVDIVLQSVAILMVLRLRHPVRFGNSLSPPMTVAFVAPVDVADDVVPHSKCTLSFFRFSCALVNCVIIQISLSAHQPAASIDDTM